MDSYIVGGDPTEKNKTSYGLVLIIVIAICLIFLIIYHMRTSRTGCRGKRVRFQISGYQDELALYKSLNSEEQQEYLKMTRDQKIEKYFS